MRTIVFAIIVAMSATGFCAGQEGLHFIKVALCIVTALAAFQIAYVIGLLTVS
jgi:hypothetical protein